MASVVAAVVVVAVVEVVAVVDVVVVVAVVVVVVVVVVVEVVAVVVVVVFSSGSCGGGGGGVVMAMVVEVELVAAGGTLRDMFQISELTFLIQAYGPCWPLCGEPTGCIRGCICWNGVVVVMVVVLMVMVVAVIAAKTEVLVVLVTVEVEVKLTAAKVMAYSFLGQSTGASCGIFQITVVLSLLIRTFGTCRPLCGDSDGCCRSLWGMFCCRPFQRLQDAANNPEDTVQARVFSYNDSVTVRNHLLVLWWC